MQRITHPISGETGFFCSEKEKSIIDAIIGDFNSRHLVVHSSRSARGVVDD